MRSYVLAAATALCVGLVPAAHAQVDSEAPPDDTATSDAPAGEGAPETPLTTTPPPDNAPLPDAAAPDAPVALPVEPPAVATAPAALRKRPPLSQLVAIDGPLDGKADCGRASVLCVKNDAFAMWPRLTLRPAFEYVQPDAEVGYIGQNDGFFLDQGRIGVDGVFREVLRFRLILDVVSFMPGGAVASAQSPVLAAARDVWVSYIPSPFFFVSVGQQFVPVDLEGSTSALNLPFARRSVATTGVRAGHGYVVGGLSPPRQVGVVVGSTEDAYLGPVLLDYKFAVANGNGQNFFGNDNKLPALYTRLGAGFDDIVKVGVGSRYNPRTAGTLPNLFTESDVVSFADAVVQVAGIQVAAQGIHRITFLSTLVPDPSNPAGQDTGLGATAWVSVKDPFGLPTFGVQPAYRISFYDPSSAFDDDQLLENSLGLRFDLPVDALPLSVFADYTFLTELGEGVRNLDNDRFTLLLQLNI